MIDLVVMIMVSVAALLLMAAAALTVVRMSRGPSSLDRVVAADVLVAIVIAGLAAEAIINDHTTTLPVMLVLSLLGFAGSVSIARFVAERGRSAPGGGASRWDVDDPERETRPQDGHQ